MNVNNVVRTITIRGASEGIEKLTADLGRLAGAQENVAIVSESSARRTLSIADAWKKQTLALDEAARSSSRAAAATKVAGNALSEGLISTQQYADRLDLIAQKYGVVTAAAEKFNRAQSLSNVNSAQAVNQRLGVKDDFNTGVRANDVAAYGRQLDDVRAKFNPLFAAGRQYKDTLTEINTAAKTGAISEKERAEAITRTKATFVEQVDVINRSSSAIGQNTKAIGLNRYELLNLSRQSQDVVVSLAGGQSPFVVLTQQGSQILDVFQAANGSVRGFFSQAIGWAGRFAASTAGVVTGVGAIGAGVLYMAGAWSEAQREIDKALIGLGRRSGVTAKDINDIARTSATATGLSVDEARGAALEFVKTGAIFRDNIRAAVAVTHDFAIVTGKDAKDAAKDLGAALASPLEGADALNSKLGFLDGRTREYIATLVSQNQKQEAQAVLLRNLAPAIQEATNTLGPFERAWNGVANAASAAKNAIGAALTPRTLEQERDALAQNINQRRDSSVDAPPGLAAQARRFNSGIDQKDLRDLERVNELLRETARAKALAFEGDKKISLDADDAVRSLLPYIDQLKKVEEQINKIKAAQDRPEVQDRQGLGNSNEQAARAAEVLRMSIQAAAEQTDRANQHALQLTQTYGTTNIEVAKQRELLDAQLGVAQAITGVQEIAAQHEATIVQLKQQGLSLSDATAIADGQRAIALAQANANADRMLISLRQEGELIRASSAAEQDRIKARQTYENLVRAGADSTKAQIVASKQLQNAEEARSKAEQEASEQAIRNIKTRQDAWDAYKRGVISWSVANDEAGRVKAMNAALSEQRSIMDMLISRTIEFNRRWELASGTLKNVPAFLFDILGGIDKLFDSNQGGKSQFNPAGYRSGENLSLGSFEDQINRLYGQGKSTNDVFNSLISGGLTKAPTLVDRTGASTGTSGMGGVLGLDTEKLNALDRLIATMSEDQRKLALASELKALQSMGGSLERDEAIKRVTDALNQLTQATEDNTSATSAMTDVLSPFYSQDPRRTHLGYRAFEGGGIMTSHGMLPLKQYDGGGIATSPQVAVFAEGRTPEAYVPVPTGRIPVTISQPANSNNKPAPQININQHFHGPVTKEMASLVKRSGFQAAQDARRVIGG